jgi:hypothetical protein
LLFKKFPPILIGKFNQKKIIDKDQSLTKGQRNQPKAKAISQKPQGIGQTQRLLVIGLRLIG